MTAENILLTSHAEPLFAAQEDKAAEARGAWRSGRARPTDTQTPPHARAGSWPDEALVLRTAKPRVGVAHCGGFEVGWRAAL
jgi:hypothetical protein